MAFSSRHSRLLPMPPPDDDRHALQQDSYSPQMCAIDRQFQSVEKNEKKKDSNISPNKPELAYSITYPLFDDTMKEAQTTDLSHGRAYIYLWCYYLWSFVSKIWILEFYLYPSLNLSHSYNYTTTLYYISGLHLVMGRYTIFILLRKQSKI